MAKKSYLGIEHFDYVPEERNYLNQIDGAWQRLKPRSSLSKYCNHQEKEVV